MLRFVLSFVAFVPVFLLGMILAPFLPLFAGWIKTVGPVQFSFEAGWLLDIYVKDDANKSRHPRAVFGMSPLLRKALP